MNDRPRQKLTPDDVREIRRLHARQHNSDGTQKGPWIDASKISEMYDVCYKTIFDIVNGKTYKDVV